MQAIHRMPKRKTETGRPQNVVTELLKKIRTADTQKERVNYRRRLKRVRAQYHLTGKSTQAHPSKRKAA